MANDTTVIIGRFQPFHNAHAALVNHALRHAGQVVVVLGSAFGSRSAKNPFTWEERAAMIRATLTGADAGRIVFVPVRDYYDEPRWTREVRQAVGKVAQGKVTLLGHEKDHTSFYLRCFPEWTLQLVDDELSVNATDVRKLIFEGGDIAGLVPPAVAQYLASWRSSAAFTHLAEEHRAVTKYQQQWSVAPYTPIFSTVDSVVTAAGHVLLIRRGGQPGKGLWAIPGGFVEPCERLLTSAIRELEEETQIDWPKDQLRDALVSVKVFDDPSRSQRGRTITHAHYFALDVAVPPSITASDDAAVAHWVPIGELASMEAEFYEDHLHILDVFLVVPAGH